jgi:HK97 family phage portal protein
LSELGDNVISVLATTVAENQALSDFALAWYQSAGNLGGVITAQDAVPKEKRDEYQKQFKEAWGRASKAGSVIMLDRGLSFVPLNPKLREADVSSLSEQAILDVARVFDLPIPLIQYKLGAQGYGNNLQVLIDGFVKFSLNRWIKVAEAELTKKLFPTNRGPYYVCVLDTTALQQGDLESRAKAYSMLIQSKVRSVNECREMEGLNALPPDVLAPSAASAPTLPLAPSTPPTPKTSSDNTQKGKSND